MNRNSILKQRTITGIIFGIVVLTMLLYSGKSAAILLAIISFGASREYISMIFGADRKKWWIVSILFILMTYLIYVSASNKMHFIYTTGVSCLFFLSGIVHLFRPFIPHKKLWWLICSLYIGLPAALLISYILTYQPYPAILMVSIILMIWANDSFAYLVGSRLGKNKLWPAISPGKTWEGFFGGGVFTLITAIIIFFSTRQYPLSFWISAALIIWVVGTLGDLFESSVKRTFQIKDSGNLLPGHGGILDRFDSFIYVLPFILFLLLIF